MDAYDIVEKIGAGNYGSVYVVKSKRNAATYVVKYIDLAQRTIPQRKEAENEVAVMSKIHHPNLIGFIEAFVENDALHIVMEYADGDDLEKMLVGCLNRRVWMPEEQILSIFVQIVLGTRQLHKQHMLHRDLKSANIFLNSKGEVKIGDFGFSKQLNYTVALASTICGTPYYFSPELCQKLPYNYKSDVWSLGVILYEMINLRKPFEAKTLKELRVKVCSEDPWPFVGTHVSGDLKALCFALLRKNSNERPALDQVLARPFVRAHLAKLNVTLAEKGVNAHNRGEQIMTQVGASKVPTPPATPAPPATPSPPQQGHQRRLSADEASDGGTASSPYDKVSKGITREEIKRKMKLELEAARLAQQQQQQQPSTTQSAPQTPPRPLVTAPPRPPKGPPAQQLFHRAMPDARARLGENAPEAAVKELQTMLVDEENANFLLAEVTDVLRSFEVVEPDVMSGPSSPSNAVRKDSVGTGAESRLREVLGTERLHAALELLAACGTTVDVSSPQFAELQKLLGEHDHLIGELQEVAMSAT